MGGRPVKRIIATAGLALALATGCGGPKLSDLNNTHTPTPTSSATTGATKTPPRKHATKPTKRPHRDAPAPHTDPRYNTCAQARAHGYGPYNRSEPEYGWYQDRDHDGQVCET